jgi:hypothetical protein
VMKNSETGWTEPTITVNGVELTFPESMSLRVAVSNFRMWLAGNGAEAGQALADGYDRHLQNIESLMLDKGRK